MLSAGLTNCGFTTGFYSSPHLVAVRERFRINGRAISPEQFADLVDRIMPIINEMRENGSFITYFEATTALAALAFREANARFAVWETGMGGRFDATNIVDPEICVITTIAVEHANHLGKTIAEIAFEKAGIIKPGIPVFCGEMSDEAKEVIEKRAMEVNAPCFFLPHS
jgi:dihydrofolate synthase/folylpolyglutamate synthase